MFEVYQRTPGRSLSARLVRILAKDVLLDCVWVFFASSSQLIEILAVEKLLDGLSAQTSRGRSDGYKWAIICLALRVFGTLSTLKHRWSGLRGSMRTRAILTAVIFNKVLTRKEVASIQPSMAGGKSEEGVKRLSSADLGQINNLIT